MYNDNVKYSDLPPDTNWMCGHLEVNALIKRIYVDNFKALNQFQMNLNPFTVIVGNNMSGKSTVLQILDFISNLGSEDFSVILERRGWKVADIKSQLQKSQKITIKCEIELSAESRNVLVCWEIQLSAYTQKNILELVSEEVTINNGGHIVPLLAYSVSKDSDNFIQDGIGGQLMRLPKFQADASLMKLMDFADYPVLRALKEFLQNSDSFELLSPEKIRLSSRGEVDSIGSAGEKLPSFIKSMNQRQKKNFAEKIRRVLDDRIIKVEAKTKGKPGWTQLVAEEKYESKILVIESKNMSDGMLRLLAFLAICEMDKKGIMLLDEIENGINLDYAEKIINILEENCQNKKNQMIVTTHSPIFLDYVEKDNIRYMYREPETGVCRCSGLTDNIELNAKMDYLYPGELLMNMSNQEIIDELLKEGNIL